MKFEAAIFDLDSALAERKHSDPLYDGGEIS